MSMKFSTGRTRRVYEIIKAHCQRYEVRQLCRLLEVTHSGYYAWLKEPQSRRAIENARLLKLIRASFHASNGIYGSTRTAPWPAKTSPPISITSTIQDAAIATSVV